MLDTNVAIETPEHIVFQHRLAGPARRGLAYLLDIALCYGAVLIVAVIVLLIGLGSAGVASAGDAMLKAGVGLILLLVFFVQWVYFVIWEGLGGRTPGKIALGMRVVSTRAQPIGFVTAALRNVLRVADALPTAYLLGVVAMLASPRFQRLGDMAAGTMVIVDERAGVAAPVRLFPPAQPQELADLPDVVALDAEERAAIELFLRRRGRLGIARERELAAMVTGALAQRFGVTARDPARTLALLYDRAANAGRQEAPPSSRSPWS